MDVVADRTSIGALRHLVSGLSWDELRQKPMGAGNELFHGQILSVEIAVQICRLSPHLVHWSYYSINSKYCQLTIPRRKAGGFSERDESNVTRSTNSMNYPIHKVLLARV